jgi:CRISPR-associated endonuclease Csn1
MKSKGPEIFSEYVEFVTNAYKEGKIGKGKFERLLMPEDNIPDDFINRQLSDTRYISREIKKILTKVVRNVYSTIGSITDYQRYMWGYDLILQRLNWEKFEKAGLTEIQHDKNGNRVYTIKNWSKRDDQRHHAIDALIIASTTNDTIKRLNDLNKIVKTKAGQSQQEALKESALLGVEEFVRSKCPFPESEVLLAAGKTLISFKSGKRVAISNKNAYRYRKGEKPVQITLTPRGFLHKEKVYGKILRYEEVKLSPRFNRFGDIAFSSSKIFLSGFLTQYNNDIKKAFSVKGIKKLMNQMNGKSIQGLEIGESAVWVTVFKPEFVISYPLKELKAKDVKFVIDKKVRDILLKRIENYGEKEAFKDIHNDPVWFNEEKKIPIKSSRIISGYDDLIPLHSTNKGFTFSRKSTVDQAIPVDYVVPRNNQVLYNFEWVT